MTERPANIFAWDRGLNGASAVLDGRGELLSCFDLPTIDEGSQRRIDAANLADLVREYSPYAFAIIEQVGSRPRQGSSRRLLRAGQGYF